MLINSKLFVASVTLVTQLMKAFQRCKELGALAQVHAENGDIIAAVSSISLSVSIIHFIEYCYSNQRR